MVGWRHRLNGHGLGWTLGVGEGQGGLACCTSWGCKESDTTEQLNNENNIDKSQKEEFGPDFRKGFGFAVSFEGRIPKVEMHSPRWQDN